MAVYLPAHRQSTLGMRGFAKFDNVNTGISSAGFRQTFPVFNTENNPIGVRSLHNQRFNTLRNNHVNQRRNTNFQSTGNQFLGPFGGIEDPNLISHRSDGLGGYNFV